MTRLQLLRTIVSTAGILIAVNAFVSILEWSSSHDFPAAPQLIRVAATLPMFWFVVGLLLFKSPELLIRWTLTEKHRPNGGSNFQIKAIEFTMMRLLGLFLLSQAAIALAHFLTFDFEFRVKLQQSQFWIELPYQSRYFISSAAGIVVKTTVGICLLLGVHQKRQMIAYARSWGRTWKSD
jgi:hypothetical protein